MRHFHARRAASTATTLLYPMLSASPSNPLALLSALRVGCSRTTRSMWLRGPTKRRWTRMPTRIPRLHSTLMFPRHAQSRLCDWFALGFSCSASRSLLWLSPCILRVCNCFLLRTLTFFFLLRFPLLSSPLCLVALPSPPCKSVCDQVDKFCTSSLQLLNMTAPDCNVINPTTQQPQFPEQGIVIPIGSQYAEIPCTFPNPKAYVYRGCPTPLVVIKNTSSETGLDCGYPCPSPIYTQDQYNNMRSMVNQMLLSSLHSFISILTLSLHFSYHFSLCLLFSCDINLFDRDLHT